MSQNLGKKPVWKTVSWAAQIADATGIDYDDLELESDEELDEDDYYDPLDDYEEPATRGKSGPSSWEMDTRARGDRPPERRREPSRQTGNDTKSTEDAFIKSEQRVEADLKREEEQNKKRDALKAEIAALNDRVVKVRLDGPSVPGVIQFISGSYLTLDKSTARQVDSMEMPALLGLEKRIAGFKERLKALEQIFKDHAASEQAIVWAYQSKDNTAKPSVDKIVAAVQAEPPDANGYAAACKELAPLYAPVAAAEKARVAFQAAFDKLDYARCLTLANKKETADLQKAKAPIDEKCSANTEQDYQAATKLLAGLSRVIDAVSKAYDDRVEKKEEFTDELKTCKAAYTASLLVLNGWRAQKKEEWKKLKAELVKELEELLSVEPKDFDVTAPPGPLGRLNEIIELMNEQADTNREKQQQTLLTAFAAADKLEYAQFKNNDNKTWVMQPLVSDKIPLTGVLIANASDQAKVDAIEQGLQGEGTCQTGRAYHCHMINNGSGGISFGYNHLGGRRVQPVIYDYATHRIDNKYDWAICKRKKSPSSAPLPGWIAARRPPTS